jgi:hypothetical protein
MAPEGTEMFQAAQLKKETDQQVLLLINRIGLLKR